MQQHEHETRQINVIATEPEISHVEEVTYDPYAERRIALRRASGAIFLFFGTVEGLMAIRFLLRLFGANPAAAFADFVYAITGPFLAPFVGLFPRAVLDEGGVVEWESLVAIAVYSLLAWALVKLIWVVFGEMRSGLTTSRRMDTTARKTQEKTSR